MKHLSQKLEKIKQAGNLRLLRDIDSDIETKNLINLSSNDYISLAGNRDLLKEFHNSKDFEELRMSASSSRLLTGNHKEYIRFEKLLCDLYDSEAAIVFGSGFHANTGIIAALGNEKCLMLADKLVHASMIDGLKLSSSPFLRYRHNDMKHLEKLIIENKDKYESILILTESIFSMDGDEADLKALVELKKRYDNIYLFIDEAHSVGVRGKNGLGCCEEKGVIGDVDFILGTLGKALASTGAYLICSTTVKEYLINTSRPFIFTTALPPVNLAWSRFILSKINEFSNNRENLISVSEYLHNWLKTEGIENISTSHIVPVMIGESDKAGQIARELEREGFLVMPVRPPTVPSGTARLRISLTADVTKKDIVRLTEILKRLLKA